ncbi:MAG: hypothetical protein WA294_12985 [Acidobacteriaceae bacterium]
MRRTLLLLGFVLAAILLGLMGWVQWQRHRALRAYGKSEQALTQMMLLVERGGDPAPVAAILRQVGPTMDAGHPAQAFALAQRALDVAQAALKALPPAAELQLPIDSAAEDPSDLYVHPQPVVIDGYAGDAMEPFISPAGRFLFFNNSNDARTNTDIFYARRTGRLSFHFLGPLPGVNSPALDAVPSMDSAGHFYFTSLREYDRTGASLFAGDFDGGGVRNVHRVPGDIMAGGLGLVNMDAGVSPDGDTLYISRAQIIPGAPAPKRSELVMATRAKGAFNRDERSTILLIHVNTGGLNYAPCIAADGLELFFTRGSRRVDAAGSPEPSVRIMVAMRAATSDSFAEPRTLEALSGFVEAPTITLDETEMFFHKKVGGRYAIWHAERRP